MIAKLVFLAFCLMVVIGIMASCVAGGRHDRKYFEKNLPVLRNGEGAYSSFPKTVPYTVSPVEKAFKKTSLYIVGDDLGYSGKKKEFASMRDWTSRLYYWIPEEIRHENIGKGTLELIFDYYRFRVLWKGLSRDAIWSQRFNLFDPKEMSQFEDVIYGANTSQFQSIYGIQWIAKDDILAIAKRFVNDPYFNWRKYGDNILESECNTFEESISNFGVNAVQTVYV